MAVAMPMIGIPMLAATFLDHKNKDEKTNQYLEQFWQLLEAYVAQWLETASVLENTRNKQLAYYVPKVTTMLRNAFGKTFEDIAKKGYMIYSPETYFRG